MHNASSPQYFWLIIIGVALVFTKSPVLAGTYIFASESAPDTVTHPGGYSGNGGNLLIRICVSPSTSSAIEMQVPVKNVAVKYNRLQHKPGNVNFGSVNDVPRNMFDFESAVMHEVGHCLGLAHVNAASESGLSGSNLNYTRSTNGPNNVFDLDPGPDEVIGSADDLRGDDGNLHWFAKNINNPFHLPTIVDNTTYTRNLDFLPEPDTFAANGDRNVAAVFGFPNTESIMQQGMNRDESHRDLIADDVATLKMAMSGLDQQSGTADDYTFQLEYRGITSSNCDITVSFNNAQTSFAVCSVSGTDIGANHMSITNADVYLNDGFNWYFNQVDLEVDGTPNAFVFNDVDDVFPSTIVVSNTVQISGIATPVEISVVGGEYSINDSPFVSTIGTVENGDFVRVRHTSSVLPVSQTSTTLTVGGVSGTFTSTTRAIDSEPDEFTFMPVSHVDPGVQVVSNSVIITGITGAVPVSISGGEYSINGGLFTAREGTINNNSSIRVRHISSDSPATTTTTTLTIGEVAELFSSTTSGGVDGTPDPFTFDSQPDVGKELVLLSNAIVVKGINTATRISVTNGSYSINGVSRFFTADSLVRDGDVVRVRHVSSSLPATTVTTTLIIGEVSGLFSSTTTADEPNKSLDTNIDSDDEKSIGSMGWINMLILIVMVLRRKLNRRNILV